MEILGFSLNAALKPWVSPLGSLDSRTELLLIPRDLARALEAFNHIGPTFAMAPGAIIVTALPGPASGGTQLIGKRTISISLPSGAQTVSGKALLRSRDHWRAHRAESSANSVQDINNSPFRPAIKLQIAIFLSVILEQRDQSRSDEIDPEIYLLHMRAFDHNCPEPPRTANDVWRLSVLAEQFLITSGWMREDPSQAQGLLWKPGPRFADALSTIPANILAHAARFKKILHSAPQASVDALSYQIADEFGSRYLDEFLGKHGYEPNFHDLIEASQLADRLAEPSRVLAASELNWYLEPVF